MNYLSWMLFKYRIKFRTLVNLDPLLNLKWMEERDQDLRHVDLMRPLFLIKQLCLQSRTNIEKKNIYYNEIIVCAQDMLTIRETQ